MNLTYLAIRFEKLANSKGISYYLAPGIEAAKLMQEEGRLGLELPRQVRQFYSHVNGIIVNEPRLEVLPLERLDLSAPNRLLFAVLDLRHKIYFDVSKMNVADQWDIVSEDNYLITHSIASFWSNKIWGWIEYRKEIWRDTDTE